MNYYNEKNIISDLQIKYNFNSYLEIGKGHAANSWKGAFEFKQKISIDINPEFEPTYLGTSDDFFKDNYKIFDLIFIDGDHSFEQVKKDLENSLKFLSENGIIVFHDTNPLSYKECYLDTGEPNCRAQSTAYKIIPHIVLNYNYYFYHVLGESGGFTILTKKRNKNVFKEEYEKIIYCDPKESWFFWEKYKNELLNIKNDIVDF